MFVTLTKFPNDNPTVELLTVSNSLALSTVTYLVAIVSSS